jgi:flagellar biosynthetic protein FliQ
MADDMLLELLKQMLWVSLYLCLPVLGVTVVIGFIIGLLQAMTSIQEQTLSFVPKLIGISLTLVLLGGWMLKLLVGYTAGLFAGLPEYGAL